MTHKKARSTGKSIPIDVRKAVTAAAKRYPALESLRQKAKLRQPLNFIDVMYAISEVSHEVTDPKRYCPDCGRRQRRE